MSVKISGVMKDAMGKPIPDCTIALKALHTTATVITKTVGSQQPEENGSYSMDVELGKYSVTLCVEGYPPNDVGEIYVHSESVPGTLNYYLGLPAEGDLPPAAIQQFEAMVELVSQQAAQVEKDKAAAAASAKAAKLSETNAKTSETNAGKNAAAALVSEKAAKTSETNTAKGIEAAAASAQAAKLSETNADGSKKAAQTSATEALVSQGAAKTSETNAGNSAKAASSSADKAKSEADRATMATDGKAESGKNSDIKSITGMDGSIEYSGSKPIGTYDLISLSSNPADSKNYLRKFRGGQGQNIFHEIVKSNRYSISIGTTDSVEVFTIDTASSVAGGVSGYFRGKKILVVSDYGIGINGAPIIEDANSVMINQFAGAGGVNGKNWFDQYQAAIIASRGYQTFQIQSNGQLGHRATATNGSTWTPWRKVWDDGNTTVDSNGFIKKASPIIKIFHDGSFDVNAESEGASVNREDIGIYRISNILGMNSDGAWGGIDGGFEVPTDRNGQRLVWLDYEVDADGSILVKTYHRTYPDAPEFARNTKDGYEEGAPIDIPFDQFLSVRVEMPQDSIWNLAQKAAQEAMEQEEITEE